MESLRDGFAAAAAMKKHFWGGDLKGKPVVAAGIGGMGGAQPRSAQ